MYEDWTQKYDPQAHETKHPVRYTPFFSHHFASVSRPYTTAYKTASITYTLIPAPGGGKLPPALFSLNLWYFQVCHGDDFLWHCYRPPGLSETVEII